MGCIVSSVACCFCSSAASLCCACLPSCKSSTSARIMFSLILIITTVLSAIALIPEVRKGLAEIPALCTPGLDCDAITGFGAVYRLCFATTMFFLLFSLIMIRFAYSWNENWVERLEDTGNKCYAVGLLGMTFLFYASSLVGIGLLYHYYASAPECALNKAFVSLNLIFCVIVSVVSVLPKVRERLATSGLLQVSITSICYVVFLTWSALTNWRDPICNPTISYVPDSNSTSPDAPVQLKFDWHVAFGLIFLVFSVLFSSFRSSSHSSVGKFTLSSTTVNDIGPTVASNSEGKQVVWDDEEDGVTYVYSAFHFLMMLATLYLMLYLTHAHLWLHLCSHWCYYTHIYK
ncbi:unnamed protein product [Echinostoma caproni]|uniref:Serine incorporator 3 n=1 Tax=Echinostoma caproni TaxID=27848 RepID=A0A183AZG4_9TREM|nr:unnamed protein product [Echinostoma caproni]